MRIRNNVTGTTPEVVHSPETGAVWEWLLRLYRRSSAPRPEPSDDLTIITWNNQVDSPLEECLRKRGSRYLVGGKELVVWNNLQKFRICAELLATVDAEYVMGLDASDVLFLGDERAVVEKFRRYGCDLLYNGERRFFPDYPLPACQESKRFQDGVGRGEFRFLNSGAWVGRAEFCRKFFGDCTAYRAWERFDTFGHPHLYNSDQFVVGREFMRLHPQIQVDYGCEVFANTAAVRESELSVVWRWH